MDGDEGHWFDLFHQFLVIAHTDFQGLGNLPLLRHALEGSFQFRDRTLDPFGLFMNGAGDPIQTAQLIQNGAANSVFCVGFEVIAHRWVVIANGIEQPDQAWAEQVILMNMRGKGHGDTAHHILHQRQILFNQIVFQIPAMILARIRLPRLPQESGIGCG